MTQTYETSQKTVELYANGALTYNQLDKLGKNDPAFFDYEINPDTAINPITYEIALEPIEHKLARQATNEMATLSTTRFTRNVS